MGAFTIILLGVLTLLLLLAATGDIRSRIIPNALNAAIALLAPLWWWDQGLALWPDVAIQFALAGGVLLVFAAAFALSMMGGGDVKLLTALALWFLPGQLARMLVIMAILGGIVTVFMLILHRARRGEGRPEIPYGVAISAAAAFIIANDILTIHGP